VAARRRGIALILVLIAAAALFPLAIQSGITLRTAAIEASVLCDAVSDEHAAHSAASVALAALTGTGVTEVLDVDGGGGSAEEPADPSEMPEMPAILRALVGDMFDEADDDLPDAPMPRARGGSSRRTRSFTRDVPLEPVVVSLDDLEWRVTVRDITSFLAINHVGEEQLSAYLGAIGVDEPERTELTHEILDWLDDDDFVRLRGMEAPGYERLGITPRNGPFEHVRELLYLPSMTPELYERIREGVTVGGDGTVNVWTAPDHLLRSLPGMDDAMLAGLLELRTTGELDEDTARRELATADEAYELLRFEPSSFVRLTVRGPEGVGAYNGWASVLPSGILGPYLEPAGAVGPESGLDGERD
jgi:hypothetical protein